jgi:sporadic carbohydrate cluster 2OG-Fe(II) oxygenase|tara:strand:- start:532 stop:1236 length:705 start_codon:yes stop_codon:yes gene_type:complete
MNYLSELTNGKGYAVFSIENIDNFKKLRNSFIDKIQISKKNNKDIDDVREEMAKMTKAEINNSMVNLLTFNDLSEMIINSCPNLVESLCGKELFLQRRAHTVVNVPGAGQAKQWPHYEMMSGISPHTYIIWAPLHDLEDQGGVYYIDQHTSLEIMKKEEESGLVNGPTVLNMMHDQKPTQLKFGQAIIFNPFILHGNISFNSDLARIACNVRFQSCHRPILQKNSDYLKYYELP